MTPEALQRAERLEERKRLGQFFTGSALARLLASLAEARDADSIIDPMAGVGDMLIAAHETGAEESLLAAIEIDAAAASGCSDRLSLTGATRTIVRTGDAFSPRTWASLRDEAWDLVITNPPYVRYQRNAQRGRGQVSTPSGLEVRQNLVANLQRRVSLSSDDRRVFCALATGYSGLADLAVPSWLLCASLVRVGGRLAMVVPDTWLSRDYALPVLYLLRRFFDVEFVVEDGQAAWFDDALVRTTLLVARRVPDRGTALHSDDVGHVHLRLEATTIDEGSIVGALYRDCQSPEHEFARLARGLLRSRGTYEVDGVGASWVTDAHLRDLVEAHVHRAAWIAICEGTLGNRAPVVCDRGSLVHVPQRVRAAIGADAIDVVSLADYGWSVGQGLRTGANRFFYGECLATVGDQALLRVDSAISAEPMLVPAGLLRTVVRKQDDLDSALLVGASGVGRVLSLQKHVLAEDLAAIRSSLGTRPYDLIPEPLAGHIRRASELEVGTPDAPRRFPDLSAVVTNVRRTNPDRLDRPPRFWYQLPEFAPRHTPEMLIPRINHGHAVAFRNRKGIVVDANFSTFWREPATRLSPAALLALLHSTWVAVVLEDSATVLGGGALKVEATHLRRVPLPRVDGGVHDQLADLGRELVRSHGDRGRNLRGRIDTFVWPLLLTCRNAAPVADRLGELGGRLLRFRNPRHA